MFLDIAIAIILLALSIVMIVKGGDVFVDAASWIAEVSGIPKLIVGATIVSFATTLPELLVSMFAAGQGKVDMSIGNAVGSVTANVGLIMAIALLFMPSEIRRRDYVLKTILMIGSAACIVIFGGSGEFSLAASGALLIFFIIAMADNVHHARAAMKSGVDEDDRLVRDGVTKKEIGINIVKFIFGALATVVGAQLMVDNGSILAAFVGVPERVISITIIAVGTSLPELVTTLTAIRKGEHSLSVGNILGANIIDLSLIMPLCAFISGGSLTVTRTVAMIDLPACLIICSVAMIPTLITKKFSRWQGVVLLVLYSVYLVISCSGCLI